MSATSVTDDARPARPPALVWLLCALCVVIAACAGSGVQPDDDAVAPADPQATAVPIPPESDDPTAQQPGVGLDPGSAAATASAPPPATAPAAPLNPAQDLAALIQGMTLEQKVGQVFTATVIGDDATQVSAGAATANLTLYGVETPAEVVQRYHLGGVAYFDHDQGAGTSNVADLSRTATLSAGLQAAAAGDTGLGLLIGTDQEGGRVVRLEAPATVFPAARDIGDTGRVDLAEQAGEVTATEARSVGVNWVYAPDADVNVNPANPVIGDRAFGTTAPVVTEFVIATARGLAAGGVLPTLKHFPGHGDTTIDSHNSLPTIDHDRTTLDQVDFPPFAAASDLAPVSVMIGHLAVPALDPSGTPATLSPAIIAVLRQDLGYDGLVVTDAMNMGALRGFGDSGALAVQALIAGVDMILMPTDLAMAWNGVRAAVLDGRIPVARLDQAVLHVLQAKDAIGVLDATTLTAPTDPAGVLGSQSHQDLREAIGTACGC
ncbi:MAG: glycoside hydrolase family 3 protein [Euzebya sp.]